MVAVGYVLSLLELREWISFDPRQNSLTRYVRMQFSHCAGEKK